MRPGINVRSYFAALGLIILTLFAAPLIVLMTPFSRRKAPTAIMRFWGQKGLRILGIRPKVTGLENVVTDRPAIFMANHESLVDILVLVSALKVHGRFIFKKSLQYMPFVGQAILLMEMVPIDRSNRTAAFASLERAGRLMRTGIQVFMFPEGTRSRSGTLLPFKKGGFHMAIDQGLTIVPCSISNTQKLCGRNSILTAQGEIQFVIHPPIDCTEYDLERRGELIERVRSVIDSGIVR